MLDLLWEAHSGPVFDATLELWVAARTDAELRTALVRLEREVTRDTLAQIDEAFGEIAREPGFRDDVEFALAAIRGVALLRAASGRGARPSSAAGQRHAKRLLRVLQRAVSRRFALLGDRLGSCSSRGRSAPAGKATGSLPGTAAPERYEAADVTTRGLSALNRVSARLAGGLLGEVFGHRPRPRPIAQPRPVRLLAGIVDRGEMVSLTGRWLSPGGWVA